MSPPSVIMRQLFLDLELGTEADEWPIKIGFWPDRPDVSMCIFDTAGRTDGRMMRTGERIEHPGVMIQLRSRSYAAAWAKANEIALALDEQRRVLIAIQDDATYILHSVTRPGPIIPLGVETEGDKRRHVFSINAMLSMAVHVEYEQFTTVDDSAFLLLPDSNPFLVLT